MHNIHEWKSNRNNTELGLVKCVLKPKSVFSGKEHTFLCKGYMIRENGNKEIHVARLYQKKKNKKPHWFTVGSLKISNYVQIYVSHSISSLKGFSEKNELNLKNLFEKSNFKMHWH